MLSSYYFFIFLRERSGYSEELPVILHKPHQNSSFSSAPHLSCGDFPAPLLQSPPPTTRFHRFDPRHARFLCFSLKRTETRFNREWTLRYLEMPHRQLSQFETVSSPFFDCTDITMSWTFLYRKTDCFNSSILRSCKVQRKETFTAGKTNTENKRQLFFFKVPSLRWPPSEIQLPFSFSALPHLVAEEKKTMTHKEL